MRAKPATSSPLPVSRPRPSPTRLPFRRSTSRIAAKPIDPPTLSVTFRINDGPLAGREGDKVQSRVIRERLLREAEGNVAIRVTPGDDNDDAFDVAGRGELQLAVLIENMRREGFELTIGRPQGADREENGQKLEPIEEVIIDVDDEHTGVVVQKLTERKGDLVDMRPSGVGRTRLRLLRPDPLADRLPAANCCQRHPRHGDLQPPVPRLPALQGPAAQPPHRRADLQRHRPAPSPLRCGTSKTAARS